MKSVFIICILTLSTSSWAQEIPADLVSSDNSSISTSLPAPPAEVRNPNEKSCEWDENHLKRSLSGRSCDAQVCSSWVVCTKNGRKSRALASCSMEFCVQGKATECVAQKGYGSIKLNFKKTANGGQITAPVKNENSNR